MSRTIGVILNLKDRFSGVLKGAGKNSKKFVAELKQAEKFVSKIESSLIKAGKAAVAFGAVSIGAGIKNFADYDAAIRQVAASTGTSLKDMDALKKSMQSVYGANYGENWEDVGNSIATVQKYLGGTGESIEEASKNALALRDTFGTDVIESMRSVDALMKNFGITSKEAFNLIGQGAQQNLDFSGELVDSINEYSSQVKKLGLSAEDMFGIFASGAENGAWNVDKIGDALKEFSIRSIDGSKTTQEGFTAIGKNANAMAQRFAIGGETARTAFFETIQGLKQMKDAVAQDAAGVALFGTMWEDLGKDVVLNMDKMGGAFDKNRQTMLEINKIKYSSFSKAVTGIGRQLSVAFIPIGETILPYLNQFANWLNVKLPNIIETFSGMLPSYMDNIASGMKASFQIVSNVFSFLKNHIQEVKAVLAGLVGAFVGLKVVTTVGRVFKEVSQKGSAVKFVMDMLKKSLLTNPFILVAVAIGVLVGAFTLLYQKNEAFRTKVQEVWGKLKEFAVGIGSIVIGTLQQLHGWFKEKIIPILLQTGQFFMSLCTKLWEFVTIIAAPVISVLQQLCSWFKEKIIPILSQIGQNFISLWKNLKEVIAIIISPIMAVIGILQQLLSFIGQAFVSLWTILQPIAAWITDVFISGIGVAFENFFVTINAILPHVQGLIEGLLTAFNGVLTFLNGIFIGDWTKAWQGVKDIFSGIWQSIKSVFLGVIETIKGHINGITSQINNVAEKASNIPIIGGIAKHIHIPQFATGTQYFKGGSALVGEHGAELVNLPKGSKVIPADKTKQILKNLEFLKIAKQFSKIEPKKEMINIPQFATGTQYFSGGTAFVGEHGAELVNLPSATKPTEKKAQLKKADIQINVTIQGNVIGNEQYANQLGNLIVKKIIEARGNL